MFAFPLADVSLSQKATWVDRLSTTFVFTIYAVMVLAALFCVFRYGRNIPLAEDWLMVAPYTGNEDDMLGWLWSQNNEHRIPLPRLVMLGLLKVTNGNFKAGMYGNVFLLSILSLGVILFLRNMRGGRTKYVDAFFPILLLHIGNWENMVWSWQLSFVMPTVMALAVFLILIRHPLLRNPRAAVATGVLLILLPLCGGNGLLFVPFLTLWLVYCALHNWRSMEDRKARNRNCGILIGCSFLAVLICGLYFIGYERPTWNPPSPGILESLKTSGRLLLLSVGPAVKFSWTIAVLAGVVLFFLFAWFGYLMLRALFYNKEAADNHRIRWIAFFFMIMMAFTLVIGWGRAGLVPQYGMPDRYVLMASPILFLFFFAGEFLGKRGLMQALLFWTMFLLLPFNTKAGFKWRNWYLNGTVALEADIAQGMSNAELAKRHRPFLVHWFEEDALAAHMDMLQKSGHATFQRKESAE